MIEFMILFIFLFYTAFIRRGFTKTYINMKSTNYLLFTPVFVPPWR